MSKFDGILSIKGVADSDVKIKSKSKSQPAEDNVQPPKKENSKRIGKRSHPDFTQITAYIKKTTHEDIMRKIYKRQEFSELLEDLLTEWLKKH